MDTRFEKGTLQSLNDCEEALLDSELGRKYFTEEGSARKAILEGIEQGNLYIACVKNRCVGFFYFILNGCFHSFPYLHMISVKREYRSKGIGKKCIDYFENVVCANESKIFLVVADFNSEAKSFYERNGYRQVGEIPNLYRTGITEYFMMKEKEI